MTGMDDAIRRAHNFASINPDHDLDLWTFVPPLEMIDGPLWLYYLRENSSITHELLFASEERKRRLRGENSIKD